MSGISGIDGALASLPDLSARIFGVGGLAAAALPEFEHRPEQEKMAFCCAQAFAGGSSIIFEAGTGVGKSMAYLVPGIVAAVRAKRQLVVATATIALQQQIVLKDIPRIRSLFENCGELGDCADFKCALLLGRANYLCTHRLKRALAEKRDLFNTAEGAELERISKWALTTKTGLKDELVPPPDPEVWSAVNADSSSCSQKNCADGTCFYRNARREIAQAQVVVVNYNLLFSMLAAGLGAPPDDCGILFAGDMLVMDEAHLARDIASECFGISVSNFGILRELKRIYNPRKKKGLITREGLAEFFDKQVVCDAIAECEEFFAGVKKDWLLERRTVRLEAPNWAPETFLDKLFALKDMLNNLSQAARSDSLAAEIKDYSRKVVGYAASIEECLWLSEAKNCVYWLENFGADLRGVRVCSAPLDVSKDLRMHVFSKSAPVVLTSATLAVGHSTAGFAHEIGADAAESFIVNSPFNYNANMRAFLSADAPEMARETKKLDADYTNRACLKFALAVDGGSLVLCTSISDMNAIAAFLRENLAQKRRVFVQGEMSRRQTVEEFRAAQNAVLVATDTFWTGIDVQGRALSQVIITRLPFENNMQPLLGARIDRLIAEGGKPFVQISLPEAILKFRQGLGRLIRSAKDKGSLVVLDGRILTRGYGRNFVDAIPTSHTERFTLENFPRTVLPALAEIGILSEGADMDASEEPSKPEEPFFDEEDDPF